MLFLGDAIYPGGNDYPAAEIGVDTVKVRDVAETAAVVSTVIACLKRGLEVSLVYTLKILRYCPELFDC